VTKPDQPTPQQLPATTAIAYALARIDALQENVAMILAQVVEQQQLAANPGKEMSDGALTQLATQILGTLRGGDILVRQHLGIEEPTP
jgi:hypothetical protein